ncbi:hypothetical protein KEM54_006161, partial [Ascosphaera aggregata]
TSRPLRAVCLVPEQIQSNALIQGSKDLSALSSLINRAATFAASLQLTYGVRAVFGERLGGRSGVTTRLWASTTSNCQRLTEDSSTWTTSSARQSASLISAKHAFYTFHRAAILLDYARSTRTIDIIDQLQELRIELEEASGRMTPTMIISPDDLSVGSSETPMQIKPYGISQATLLEPDDHLSMFSAQFDDDALSIRSFRFQRLSEIDDHNDTYSTISELVRDSTDTHHTQLAQVAYKDVREGLDSREAELVHLRKQLSEMNQYYRHELQQRASEINYLRAKLVFEQAKTNGLVEKARKEVAAAWAAKAARLVEKARHQVEDSWEVRWRERDICLMQKFRRLEDENAVLQGTNLELIRSLADAQYKKGELDEEIHQEIKDCM